MKATVEKKAVLWWEVFRTLWERDTPSPLSESVTNEQVSNDTFMCPSTLATGLQAEVSHTLEKSQLVINLRFEKRLSTG